MAGIPSDASEVRRGVRLRTVTAFPFESSAGETKDTGHHYLTDIRNISDSLRIRESGCDFEKLCWLLKLKIVEDVVSIKDFEELCEGLVSLLYYGLAYPKQGRKRTIETIFRYFIDKWFSGYENYDFNQLVFDIEEQYQKSSFASVLLFYNHFEFVLQSADASALVLQWGSPHLPVPQWLREVLSCSENTYKNLSKVLYKSLHYADCKIEVEFNREYLKALSTFLDACHKYKSGNYVESLELLSSINRVNCGQFLIGWSALMCGLNMEYLGKSQSALMKYKEALKCTSNCFYALYYSARVFKEMGSVDAHLQCLRLLTLVNIENCAVDSSLQRILISYHLPLLINLPLRASWLLASSYLFYKRWTDARDHFQTLLTKWKVDEGVSPIKRQKSSLFPLSDNIPELPPKSCARIGYISSLMFLKEYEEAEMEMRDDLVEDAILDDFEKVETREKIDKLSTVLCQLMFAESLYKQLKLEEALIKCGRILVLIESLHGSTDSWKILLLLTKAYLYKMMSLLYHQSPSSSRENSLHFTRLQDHCLLMVREADNDPQMENKTYSVFFENTEVCLTERIEQLC